MSCACDRVGELELQRTLDASAEVIGDVLACIAAAGARPGNAVLVLTDRDCVGWFFAPGPVPVMEVTDAPMLLGRRLDAVIPRVMAECVRCAERILRVPLTHLPVYLRAGEAGTVAVAIGAVRFPEALRAQASAVAPTPYAGVRPGTLRRLTDGELPGGVARSTSGPSRVHLQSGSAAMVLRPEDLAAADQAIARAMLGELAVVPAHAEAFCLLRYRDEHGGTEVVWNSHDGAAPPAFEHPLTGGLFVLDAAAALERAPHHQPAQGDLVWVPLTEARALAERRAYVAARWDVDVPYVGPLSRDPRFAGMSADDAARWLAAQDLAGPGRAVLVRWGMELAS